MPVFNLPFLMPDEVAFKIRDAFPPGTVDELVVQYLAGLNVDTDEDPEDIVVVTKAILDSAVPHAQHSSARNQLAAELAADVRATASKRVMNARPTLQRLDNVIDMSKSGALSNTIGFSEGVDLSSINKGK